MMSGWTVKGLVRKLARSGVRPEDMVEGGKLKSKFELYGMVREIEFERECRAFREHMAWVRAGGTTGLSL